MKKWLEQFLSVLQSLFDDSDEGQWHDPKPCRQCGMRIFYAVDHHGDLRLKCAMCRKDE